MASYELISVCSLWLTKIVSTNEGRFSLSPDLPRHEAFDRILLNLITLMDDTSKRLELYMKLKDVVEPVLNVYELSVYGSMLVCQEMQFTNSSELNSRLSFGYRELTEKLGEVVVSLHKVLENVFVEVKKGAIKTKAAVSYKTKERNLRAVEPILKNIDVTFSIGDKLTHRNESEFLSNRKTKTLF